VLGVLMTVGLIGIAGESNRRWRARPHGPNESRLNARHAWASQSVGGAARLPTPALGEHQPDDQPIGKEAQAASPLTLVKGGVCGGRAQMPASDDR
jgi:hypothetical protein